MEARALLLLWLLTPWAGANFIGEEGKTPLQKTAIVGGETRDLGLLNHTINTDRTSTFLNCTAGAMELTVNFRQPFYGIIRPNGTRHPSCTLHGTGETMYQYILPLKGCGTNRIERRVFLNNIIIHFHPKLELENDEVKTIICRYPSPKVIEPLPPVPIKAGPTLPVALPQKVGELEVLLIICSVLFLSLLLVGMACSYTCLKRRNIKIVRRSPSLGPPSDISKLSETPILFDGLKIPRAHATSTSDTDTALMSSDYPSESPSSGSEVEEADTQSYQNQAFVEEERLSSVYSDAHVQSEAETIMPTTLVKPPQPTFMVRVKRAPTPPRTPEPDYPVHLAQTQNLTTIVERDESLRPDSIPDSEHALLVSGPEDFEEPPTVSPPVLYSQVQLRTQQVPVPPPSEYESAARSCTDEELEADLAEPPVRDVRRTENVHLLKRETVDVEEVVSSGVRKYMAPRPPSEPDSEYPSEARSVTDLTESLPVAVMPPTRSAHNVDDLYHSTITETHTVEDVQRHRRYIKQYHTRPRPLPPPSKWNVAIRHYPGPKYADELESSGPEWEAYSEPGSDVFRSQLYPPGMDVPGKDELDSLEHPPPPNWNVLLRVLGPPPTETAEQCILTQEDREKWRQILCTESTLRTMLTTAVVEEDYQRIREDQRYHKLFEPRKWDVIIRILSPPTKLPRQHSDSSSEAESVLSQEDPGYKPREDPSRRRSLPPVHEYDSEGVVFKMASGDPRSRRSSKSSMHSGFDVRSMTETEVNFARGALTDTCSDASGPSMVRSTADRSHTEMTYSVPVFQDSEDFDDQRSSRTARSLVRSASEFTEDWHHHEPSDRYSVTSTSSGEARLHHQGERAVSELYEHVPHLSDRSLSSSPQLGLRRAPHYDDEFLDDLERGPIFSYHERSEQEFHSDQGGFTRQGGYSRTSATRQVTQQSRSVGASQRD